MMRMALFPFKKKFCLRGKKGGTESRPAGHPVRVSTEELRSFGAASSLSDTARAVRWWWWWWRKWGGRIRTDGARWSERWHRRDRLAKRKAEEKEDGDGRDEHDQNKKKHTRIVCASTLKRERERESGEPSPARVYCGRQGGRKCLLYTQFHSSTVELSTSLLNKNFKSYVLH